MKLTKILPIGFFILFLIDIVTAYIAIFHHGHKWFEANPVSLLPGGMFIIIALNFLIIFLLWRSSRSPNYSLRFFAVTLFVWSSAGRITAIWSNIQSALAQPVVLEAAQQAVSVAEKTQAYTNKWVIPTVILPFFLSMLTYWLFTLDHDIKEKPYEPPRGEHDDQ